MEKGASVGMQTFDQALYDLYKSERISLDDALNNADSRGNLEWQINFGGGVKSVSESSEQLVFPSESVEEDTEKTKDTPVITSSFGDENDSDEDLDSHVGFDDNILDEDVVNEGDAVEPGQGVFDDTEAGDKDADYLKRLKSVFGDK